VPDPQPKLVLASASPRRRALLAQVGLQCDIRPVDLDESAAPGEAPEDYVSRLARQKGEAASRDAGEVVVAADTIVVLDGESLGKPLDQAHARRMLARLSGRDHEVMSAVAVVADSGSAMALSRTRVWMRPVTSDEIDRYCASGEPMDKAGAYAIQGLAASFVTRLDGSYSGVVGLPLYETLQLLADCGVAT
jgi:septum formation protein